MESRVLVVWIMVFLRAGMGFAGSAQTVDQHTDQPTLLLVNYLIDQTDTKNISDVTKPVTRWKQASEPMLTLGFLPHHVWCRFTIQQKSNTPRQYALELTNYFIDSVTLYQPLAGQTARWMIQHKGDAIPFIQQNPKTRYPTFYIQLPDNKPHTFYARILHNQFHEYQFRVWDQATFIEHRLPDAERYLFMGAIVMLFMYHLTMLSFMYRYRVLRSYALFSILFCSIGLCSFAIPSTLFPTSPYWANLSHYITVGLILPTLGNYIVQAFRIYTFSRGLLWVYGIFGLIGFGYAGLSFFVRNAYLTQVFTGIISIMMIFSFVLIPILYKRGIRPAVWNVLALFFILPPYGYFYGHHAGFFDFKLSERTLWLAFFTNVFAEPFLIILLLWQATRERIQSEATLIEEKARNENLQELDQIKTNFFTNISHELRTPVTLLVWPLQTLQTRFPSDQIYAMMYRNVSRLHTLINQLLDLASLDAGQIKATPTPGNLVADLRNWVALFESAATKEGVQLLLHQDQPQWFALYDTDKMEKIITNLLSNALKYLSINPVQLEAGSARAGSVTVRATYLPTGVTISVTDTGIGIATEAIPHLFDRFYQAAKPQPGSRFQDSSGVGLALVSELVKLLGGTIQVASVLGEGSTFTVWVPLQQTKGELITESKGLPSPANGNVEPETEFNGHPFDHPADLTTFIPADNGLLPKPLLLLVEDNPELRAQLREILAPYYELREASDGQQGLAIALETLPDLIVTDLVMPLLDGLDLCRSLRADSRTDHIPVVMLTAKAALSDRLTGLETGADDYLTKPFLPTELLIRLQNLRRRQEAVRTYWQRMLAQPTQSLVDVPDSSTHSAEKPVHDHSERFLNQLYEQLERNLDQPGFEVEQLASRLAMSSRTLNRKLNSVLGISAREVIWTYRLRRAQDLLRAGLSPTDVSYLVGFSSLTSFSRAYKERYGYRPSAEKS